MRVHLTPEQSRAFGRVLALAKRFLSAQGGKPDEAVVTLRADTNLLVEIPGPDITYRSSVVVERIESPEDEAWQVPALLLSQIVSGGEGTVLNIDREAGFMIVHRGVSRWQFGLYKGVTIPAVENVPDELGTVNGAQLHTAIDHVRFCVRDDDDTRPYLRAMDCKNGRVRGCDGAMYSHYDLQDKITFSLPAHVVDSVRAYLKINCEADKQPDIGFGESEYAYHFSSGHDTVSIAKPSFEYPDLDTIIVRRVREQLPCVLVVPPLELQNALSDVAVVSEKKDSSLELRMTRNEIHMSCKRRGGTEASTTIPASWASPERTAHFDVSKFRDLLNSVASSGQTEWEIKFGHDNRDRKSPIVVEGRNTWTMLNQVRPS